MAFSQDPITGFLLQTGRGYQDRVTQFFSLLMRARIALKMPVLVAQGTAGIHGAAMGYATVRPAWPTDLAEEWDCFESATPGLTDRMAVYDEIAGKYKPSAPHYYLGVIGIDPNLHGRGFGEATAYGVLRPFGRATACLAAFTWRRLRRPMSGSTSAPAFRRLAAEASGAPDCGACICRIGRDDGAA